LASTVESIMTKKVITINLESTVKEAVKIMGKKHIGCVVVEGTAGPIGFISEFDIISRCLAVGQPLEKTLILEVMSLSYGEIDYRTSIVQVAKTMREKKRLLVIKKSKIVGIVTPSDLIQVISKEKRTAIGTQGVMSKNVITIEENSTILEAVELMSLEHVGSIIVTKKRKPISIFAERDLMTKVLPKEIDYSTEVGYVSSSPLISAPLGTDMQEAAYIMVSNHIRRLPIFRGKELVGILTPSDLIKAFSQNH